MQPTPLTTDAEVFISYATADRERVVPLFDQLASAGVSVWLDRHSIEGASRWSEEIVHGIESCRVFVLMCSDAAMRSWAVKQELQLAGECQKALLPLILKQTSFPAQMRFFLAGWQWIELLDHPPSEWLPRVLRALHRAGVSSHHQLTSAAPASQVEPVNLAWNWEELRRLARFTNQIWPVPAESVDSSVISRRVMRGLGAAQDSATYEFRIGRRMQLVIEADKEGHLLLLDEGPEGIIYCLCPSHFASSTNLPQGRSILPQARSRHDSFVVSGVPGREQLLAIITNEPMELDWMPSDPSIPARILTRLDIDALLVCLRGLEVNQWAALSTYFDVLA